VSTCSMGRVSEGFAAACARTCGSQPSMALRSLLVCGRGSAAGRVHFDLLCHPPENAPQLPDELSRAKRAEKGTCAGQIDQV
jgi:hypothetical protein